MTSSLERQQWLEAARDECVRLLAEHDCAVPSKTRVAIGFPASGARGKTIGQCWHVEAVTDEYAEVFISPRLRSSQDIMATLIHELIHAACGAGAKHGPLFRAPAVAVGLEGKMTATHAGEALQAKFRAWIDAHGEYPAGAIDVSTRKKQATRLLKCQCQECGYTARVTAKWINEVGPPHCPEDGPMTVTA